jgi:hypothetical protein
MGTPRHVLSLLAGDQLASHWSHFLVDSGRGVEALAAARHQLLLPSIGRIETAAAALLLISGAIIFLAPLADWNSHADDDFPWGLLSITGAMWALLGAGSIAARIAQWRIRRRSKLLPSTETLPA